MRWILLLLLSAFQVHAEEISAIKNGNLVLSDGKIVHLAGINPKNDDLAGLVGESVYLEKSQKTRYGHYKAWVYLDRWPQSLSHILVMAGKAKVNDFDHDVEKLLALEQTARKFKEGLWANETLLTAQSIEQNPPYHQFVIIKAKVHSIFHGKKEVFVDLSPKHWKENLSLVMDKKMFKKIKGLEKNRNLIVRGELYHRNGPMITIENHQQVQLFTDSR